MKNGKFQQLKMVRSFYIVILLKKIKEAKISFQSPALR